MYLVYVLLDLELHLCAIFHSVLPLGEPRQYHVSMTAMLWHRWLVLFVYKLRKIWQACSTTGAWLRTSSQWYCWWQFGCIEHIHPNPWLKALSHAGETSVVCAGLFGCSKHKTFWCLYCNIEEVTEILKAFHGIADTVGIFWSRDQRMSKTVQSVAEGNLNFMHWWATKLHASMAQALSASPSGNPVALFRGGLDHKPAGHMDSGTGPGTKDLGWVGPARWSWNEKPGGWGSSWRLWSNQCMTPPDNRVEPWICAISISLMIVYHTWPACLPGRLPAHVLGASACKCNKGCLARIDPQIR